MCLKTFSFALVLFASIFSTVHAQTDPIGSGRAISFDGIDDYIDFGDVYEDLQLPFTISAWVYLDPTNSAAAPIFTNRNCDPIYTGFRLIVNNSLISMDYGDGLGGNSPAFRRGKNANTMLLTGNWNHITAVVRDISDMELYLNGVNVGGEYIGGSSKRMDSSKPGFASTGYFISNGVKYRFKGQIDDIRLWNRALSAEEIRRTMCINLIGNEPGLIGYWDFNEMQGSIVYDRSTNRFDGRFIGGPMRTRSGAPIGDVSTYLYTSNWTNNSVELDLSDQHLKVTDVAATVRGVHVYGVNSPPSDQSGLPSAMSRYFGVFLAQQEPSATFSSTITTADQTPCGVFTRNDNSSSAWSAASTATVTRAKRVEIIQNSGEIVTPFDLGADRNICGENEHSLVLSVDPKVYSIKWNTGETTPTIVARKPGKYVVTVSGACSQIKDSVTIEFSNPPTPFSLGNDIVTCEDTPTKLSLPANHSEDIVWDDGSKQAVRELTNSGSYWATATNACGTVSDTIKVTRMAAKLEIPNVITPNGDGRNDTFIVDAPEGVTISVEVYNRWGQQLFYSPAYDNRWNGMNLPSGAYYYVINSGCGASKKGTLSIVR